MWGRYIEHELHDATKKAKNESQANQKAMMAMRRIMNPPSEDSEDPGQPKAAPQKFRDPAQMMKKG